MNPYGAPPQGPQNPYGAPPQGAQNPYGAPPPGPQNPYGAPPAFGGAPMPGGNPFAARQLAGLQQAQQAMGSTQSMMKGLRYGLPALGGLLVLGGIAALVFLGLESPAIPLIVSGLVVAATGWFYLPKFMGLVDGAASQVNALAQKQQLAATGLPAAGRLLQVQQTGAMVNFNPEVFAVVEVRHPQLGVYQAQTTAIVPQIAIPRAQPGAEVQVRVSPTNPQEIALLF